MFSGEEKPDWWEENKKLRKQLDLPFYEPPRFSDGKYTHELLSELEDIYRCEIQLMGIDTRYPDDWTVRVDGEEMFDLPRHRDDNGNTVYELSSQEFRDKFTDHTK